MRPRLDQWEPRQIPKFHRCMNQRISMLDNHGAVRRLSIRFLVRNIRLLSNKIGEGVKHRMCPKKDGGGEERVHPWAVCGRGGGEAEGQES